MKHRQLSASIKAFQAQSSQLQRPPAFPVWSLSLSEFMKKLMKLWILSHNKPNQNMWISAPERTLRNRQQLWILTMSRNRGDKKNITTIKDVRVRSGLWSAEQLKAEVFSAGCHQVCLHLTGISLYHLLLLLTKSWHIIGLSSLDGHRCGRNGDAVTLSKWKWRGNWSHLMLPSHFHLIQLFLLLSPPMPSPANDHAPKQIRSQMSHAWSIYTIQKVRTSFLQCWQTQPDKAVYFETQV